LENVLGEIPAFRLIPHEGSPYPLSPELGALYSRHSPAVVFVDIADLASALDVASFTAKELPATQLVAIGRSFESQTVLAMMRSGVRECLPFPFRPEEAREALSRLQRALGQTPVAAEPAASVFSFLPAKPGAGASTICLNTAVALSRLPEVKVALLDFDLFAGTQDFLLNLDAGFSIRDAAEHAEHLDDAIWLRMISKAGNLDVLRAGQPDPDRLPSPWRLQSLVRYARKHYTAVCIDLAGAADPVSAGTLRNSNRIFLVTTPEIASLHMAERVISLVKEMRLDGRLGVIVNRIESNSPRNRFQIEELLGVEVVAAVPNSYEVLQRALNQGRAAIQDGPLGTRFLEFAESLRSGQARVPKKTGLLHYFDRFLGNAPVHWHS
jgi:pilus assembly protein CpaE